MCITCVVQQGAVTQTKLFSHLCCIILQSTWFRFQDLYKKMYFLGTQKVTNKTTVKPSSAPKHWAHYPDTFHRPGLIHLFFTPWMEQTLHSRSAYKSTGRLHSLIRIHRVGSWKEKQVWNQARPLCRDNSHEWCVTSSSSPQKKWPSLNEILSRVRGDSGRSDWTVCVCANRTAVLPSWGAGDNLLMCASTLTPPSTSFRCLFTSAK